MSYSIKGKTILITGANRGIGKSLVEQFTAYGAKKIYAAVRTLSKASALVEKYGDKVVPVYLDLTDKQSVFEAAKTAKDVQVVVNNGGILATTSIFSPDAISEMRGVLETNVYGLIYMVQAFAPVLKINGGGVFSHVSGIGSMKAFPKFALTSASKAAAYSIMQTLRKLLAGQGTIVLSIHPGPIKTDMMNKLGITDIAESPELVARAIIEALENGAFHVFPGSIAGKLGEAYEGFAQKIVLADHHLKTLITD